MKRIGIGNSIGKWYTLDIHLIDEMFTFWLWTPAYKKPCIMHHDQNQYEYGIEQCYLPGHWFFGLQY